MELPLKLFSKLEYERKYELHKFSERGLPMAFLKRKSQKRINSGNKYKFGVITHENKYYWFFNGVVTCRSRLDAIKAYSALLKYCQENKIGQPFIYKE